MLDPLIGFILNTERRELLGEVPSTTWKALNTKAQYSTSVVWGIVGPKVLLSRDSPYYWIPYGFLAGAAVMFLVWVVHKKMPHWRLETRFNPALFFAGAALFPRFPTSNLMTSALVSFIL